MTRRPRKTGNGNGTVHKRDKRSRAGYVTGHDADGTARKWRSSFATSREAHDALAVAKAGHQQGKFTAGTRQTLAAVALRWLEDDVRICRRYSTYVARLCDLRAHVLPTLGKVALSALTAERVWT